MFSLAREVTPIMIKKHPSGYKCVGAENKYWLDIRSQQGNLTQFLLSCSEEYKICLKSISFFRKSTIHSSSIVLNKYIVATQHVVSTWDEVTIRG